MVSRRNFLSITVIILVILFMFQLSGVVKETWNDFGQNQYADCTKTDLTLESPFSLQSVNNNLSRDYVIYVGNMQDNSLASTVKEWCIYTKRGLLESASLEGLNIDKDNPPEIVLLDSNYVDWNKDVPLLQTMVNSGINFVFCNLPSENLIESNSALQNILGITFISAPSVKLVGIKLFEGFLLGGEEIYDTDKAGEEEYQDLELNVPWYSVTSGTKTYMVGLLDKIQYKDVGNEYLPAIIWRNSIGKSRVFAVNGDYLSTNTGIGILDAMMAELHDYEIYPVVNAQSIITVNYPVLSKENEDEMLRRYSRSSDAVFENIIWPGIVTLTTKMNAKLTCIMNPQFNYEDKSEPDADDLEYYFKLISEQKGEVGLSGIQKSNFSLKDKLKADYQFIHGKLPNYKITSFYTDNTGLSEAVNQLDSPMLQNVRTILMDYNEHDSMASYVNQNVLALKATIDGFSHTYSQDLRIKSLETSLGYSAILADMERVLYPAVDKDEWEYLYNDFSRFTTTFWRDFSAFDQTTLSESDKRMREFLALDYSDSRSKNTITLDINKFSEEGWFLLRTHDESIVEVTGGTYKEIERNAYLIFANKNTVKIQLKKSEKPYYTK